MYNNLTNAHVPSELDNLLANKNKPRNSEFCKNSHGIPFLHLKKFLKPQKNAVISISLSHEDFKSEQIYWNAS